jgi:hypothetical protein
MEKKVQDSRLRVKRTIAATFSNVGPNIPGKAGYETVISRQSKDSKRQSPKAEPGPSPAPLHPVKITSSELLRVRAISSGFSHDVSFSFMAISSG